MRAEELRKLRAYYHSLLGQQRSFERSDYISPVAVHVLSEELSSIEADFPGLLPRFDASAFQIHIGYKFSGIAAYFAAAIARLEVAIDTSETTPVTETRECSFVRNAEFRIRHQLSPRRGAWAGQYAGGRAAVVRE